MDLLRMSWLDVLLRRGMVIENNLSMYVSSEISFTRRFLWMWPGSFVGGEDTTGGTVFSALQSTSRIWDDGIVLPIDTR